MEVMSVYPERKQAITPELVIAAASLLIAAVGLVFVILGYLLPPDPAHPTRFDFLSHIVSIPFWLAAATVFGAAAMTGIIVRWWIRRKIKDAPVVVMSANPPSRVASYFGGAGPYVAPHEPVQPVPVPATIIVELKTVLFEMDVPGLVIVLTNRGGSEARHIQVDDVAVADHTVRFLGSIETLRPGESSNSLVPNVIEFKESRNHEIGSAMYEGITAKTRNPNDRYDYQGGAHFYDVSGKRWHVSWVFTFFPRRYKKYIDGRPDDDESLEPYLTVSRMSTDRVD